MRKELERKIGEARHRLEGGTLTEEDRAENMQHQAIEDFMVFLAKKIDFNTRTEFLLGADYFWQETGPAVRFELDGRVFILAQGSDQVCHLYDETVDQDRTALFPGDSHFQDRLLIAIDTMLKN